MNQNTILKILILLVQLVLASCTVLPSAGTEPPQPATAPVSTEPSSLNMANPASAYCTEQGNRWEIRMAADGSQSGVCIFPDDSECDEWVYFRGECAPKPLVAVPTQTIVVPLRSVIPQFVPLPAGAIIHPRDNTMESTKSVILYNLDGLTLGKLLTPNAEEFHAAGQYQGSLNFLLVFRSIDPDTQKQYINFNTGKTPTDPGGQVSALAPLADQAMIAGLVGVPGKPLLLYIYFHPAPNILQSEFVFSPVESISTAMPLFTMDSN